MDLPNLLGMVGVACVLGAYALLQAERLDQRDRVYSAINAVGAALILVSLVYDFNLPSAVVEVAWLIISIYGLVRPRGRSKGKGEDGAVDPTGD